MTERGWTTVLVRCIGVYFLAVGLINLLQSMMTTARHVALEHGARGAVALGTLMPVLLALVPMAVGVWLVFRSGPLIEMIARNACAGCRACGYPVDNSNPNCPECGTPEPDEKSQL